MVLEWRMKSLSLSARVGIWGPLCFVYLDGLRPSGEPKGAVPARGLSSPWLSVTSSPLGWEVTVTRSSLGDKKVHFSESTWSEAFTNHTHFITFCSVCGSRDKLTSGPFSKCHVGFTFPRFLLFTNKTKNLMPSGPFSSTGHCWCPRWCNGGTAGS